MDLGWMDTLFQKKNGRSRRISSWDRTGKNNDWVTIKKGETKVIADISGTGCIRHIWVTINCPDRFYLRKILLKVYWDNEDSPSVLTPIGDFFGVGHGVASHYASIPFSMIARQDGPQINAAMNCFLPMPLYALCGLCLQCRLGYSVDEGGKLILYLYACNVDQASTFMGIN